jgi:hypothetical protein
VAGPFEDGNETSDAINGGDFPDQLSYYKRLLDCLNEV